MIVLKGALDFKTGQPPQFGKENCIANRILISTNAEKSN